MGLVGIMGLGMGQVQGAVETVMNQPQYSKHQQNNVQHMQFHQGTFSPSLCLGCCQHSTWCSQFCQLSPCGLQPGQPCNLLLRPLHIRLLLLLSLWQLVLGGVAVG